MKADEGVYHKQKRGQVLSLRTHTTYGGAGGSTEEAMEEKSERKQEN